MMFKKYLALFVCLLGVVFAQDTLPFTVAIFDQHPSLNGNFQPPDGSVTTGLVVSNLNPITKVPELVTLEDTTKNYDGRMLKPSLFKYFFSPDATNIFLNVTLPLTKESSSGFYEYFNDFFFPIDGKGWDAYANMTKYYQGHNFHFCLKMNTYFKYKLTNPPMQFNFRGDDDVWVFINNKLALDLGGLHSYEDGSIIFDSTTSNNLGLVDNKIYSFDFYYCERKTEGSHMRFQINFPLDCTTKDYCGVCNGGGDCCNAKVNCNTPPSGSKCYTPTCPAWDAPNIDPKNLGKSCVYTPITYNNLDNQCWDFSCDANTGAAVPTAKPCVSKPCTTSKCTNSTGCAYTSTCTAKDACSLATCDADGRTCKQSAKNCDFADKCYNYGCDAVKGCNKTLNYNPVVTGAGGAINNCQIRKCDPETGATTVETIANCDKCTGTPNKCQIIGQCNAATGQYTFIDKPQINDGNACTQDKCDLATGAITHTPLSCAGCTFCDPELGEYKCSNPPTLCNDQNPCTTDTCATNGNCTNTFCAAPTNKCLIPVCTETGCSTGPIVCPESENPCEEAICSETTGCGFKARDCLSGIANCTDGFCDARLGCVSIARQCVADKPNCQYGVCNNETNECEYHDYDPYPFACQTAAVVSVGVVAGVVVAGAVALAAAVFGGKKGYDYWKEHKGMKMNMSNANPLYETKPGTGENPLYHPSEQ
ncbi:PA14 domain-containing protein [Cavenderia fasciculata]|uniref:PA14 domain-containing protein n=1 Tax=Cavenderia fasciculata TaxID=261658 RepID=F4PIB8_CACFS|nr:PA14 domain-containing protein [Cavenderia fasciculata]EGG24552.1 PA14 domain-containing protein [Cavenderia fasciculata]|eukprot:XP_004362403.1 PA14 domain-containing protein [Cavenderia fasciculata]